MEAHRSVSLPEKFVRWIEKQKKGKETHKEIIMRLCNYKEV